MTAPLPVTGGGPGNRCCIAGGGPAGVMLGFLLARAGVPVIVFEKHADFLRDFRGDTVHPSTLQLLHELGLLERFLARPHQEYPRLSAQIGDAEIEIADFSHLPTAAKFLVLMPQWEFLNFLTSEASRFPAFSIAMNTAVTGLIEDEGVVRGVSVTTPDGQQAIPARLVIGADGRESTVRSLARLEVTDMGSPIDVLWFSLPRQMDDRELALGRFQGGRILVLINRGDYYQCGLVIPKDAFEGLKAAGLGALRQALVDAAPFLADRVVELRSWDEVKLLSVSINHLGTWHKPGLLCIGDAAHAMSPIGGVGINLAIQDAVATANLLAGPLSRHESVPPELLARVQERRCFPTFATQRVQLILQRVVFKALALKGSRSLPLLFRLLQRFPALRRIPARVVGLGVRPEHVLSPAADYPESAP